MHTHFLVPQLYGALSALYAALAYWNWRGLRHARPTLPWLRWALIGALSLHAGLLVTDLFVVAPARFGFAMALSSSLWLTLVVVTLESFFVPMRAFLTLVLPLAAVSVLLPKVFPGALIQAELASSTFRLHLLVALAAYSVFTIAAVHALLMAALSRRLQSGHLAGADSSARFLDDLPPLLAMETLLFRLVWVGFLLLSLTLITGFFFSEELFGRLLRLDHKTVFTFAALLVFGGLLLGRRLFGWRGRIALRWTLTGFVMLLLAYVGARFVAEVILGRI